VHSGVDWDLATVV
jgi:hypothetical protein